MCGSDPFGRRTRRVVERAQPPGIPNSRFRGDTGGPAMVREAKALARERTANTQGALAPASYLGLSGGSDNGAFGAGLLVGWTETETRPEFKLVAGTSTGALISSFDPQLRALHTTIQPSDLYEERWLPIVVFSDALAGIDPPFHLMSHDVNKNMLDDIAREYRRGRLLLIGTTTLDVRRR